MRTSHIEKEGCHADDALGLDQLVLGCASCCLCVCLWLRSVLPERAWDGLERLSHRLLCFLARTAGLGNSRECNPVERWVLHRIHDWCWSDRALLFPGDASTPPVHRSSPECACGMSARTSGFKLGRVFYEETMPPHFKSMSA